MNIDRFWRLVEDTYEVDSDDHLEALQDELIQLPPDDIIDFEQHLHRLLAKAYTAELWGAAYIINEGCSDDGFDYFRAWLIAQGRIVYESALSDPDSLADFPDLIDGAEFEEFWYVARGAYEDKTGHEIPDNAYRDIQQPEICIDWNFDDFEEMTRRYPRLMSRLG